MKLKPGPAVLGALAAGGGLAAVYFLLGVGWISFLVVAIGGILSYVIAALGFASRASISSFGEFTRGWLIGMNSAANGFLAYTIVSMFADSTAGMIVGPAMGLLTLLSVFAVISQSGVYQAILGWGNWLMPTSWLVVALGLLFYVVSALFHLFTGGKSTFLRIQDMGVDWSTGTFFMKGGLIANLNPIDTAFNMGSFSFVDYKSGIWHKSHEAGHTLNLAAFGSVFHLIGALDENATSRGEYALSERIAESNATAASGANIPMWR